MPDITITDLDPVYEITCGRCKDSQTYDNAHLLGAFAQAMKDGWTRQPERNRVICHSCAFDLGLTPLGGETTPNE